MPNLKQQWDEALEVAMIYIPRERWDEFNEYAIDKGIGYDPLRPTGSAVDPLGPTSAAEIEIAIQQEDYETVLEFVNMQLREPIDYFCPDCGEISRLQITAVVEASSETFLDAEMKARKEYPGWYRTLWPAPGKSKPKVTKICCLQCHYADCVEAFTLWQEIKGAKSIRSFPEILASGLPAIQRMAREKIDELKGEDRCQ